MGVVAIREKLLEYIRIADDKMIKALYTVLERDIEETLSKNKKIITKSNKNSKTGKTKYR